MRHSHLAKFIKANNPGKLSTESLQEEPLDAYVGGPLAVGDESESASAAILKLQKEGAELDNAAGAADQLDGDLNTAQGVYDQVADAQVSAESHGGMDVTAAYFMNVALEHSVGKYMDISTLVPSCEDFSGDIGAIQSTQLALESLGEWIANKWTIIKEAFRKVWIGIRKVAAAVFSAGKDIVKGADDALKLLEAGEVKTGALKVKASCMSTDAASASDVADGYTELASLAKVILSQRSFGTIKNNLGSLISSIDKGADAIDKAAKVVAMSVNTDALVGSITGSGVKTNETPDGATGAITKLVRVRRIDLIAGGKYIRTADQTQSITPEDRAGVLGVIGAKWIDEELKEGEFEFNKDKLKKILTASKDIGSYAATFKSAFDGREAEVRSITGELDKGIAASKKADGAGQGGKVATEILEAALAVVRRAGVFQVDTCRHAITTAAHGISFVRGCVEKTSKLDEVARKAAKS